MSDNKVNGAGSNSWGLSTLVEAAMGEPEATTTSDAGAPAQKEVARNQQDSSQQDSFEQDGGSEADDFMAWAGAKATSMSEDASKLIDEGMETVSTTVGDLLQGAGDAGTGSAPISEKHVDGLRDLSKVVDRTASEIREAANDVSQTVEDVEILDAETNRKLDRLASMDAKEFFSMGLDEIGLDAGKRAEIEQHIDHQISIAREEVDAIGRSLPWGDAPDNAANMATQVLGGAAELLGDARELLEGHEQALSTAKSVGSDLQTAGTLALVTGAPVAPFLFAAGATLEWVGNSPETLATAQKTALKLESGIENFDPKAMAERAANLPDGEAVNYVFKGGVDIHEGLGAKVEVSAELKVEKKGDKFLIEIKSDVSRGLGVGVKAMGEGGSLDLVSRDGGTVLIECDSADGVETLAKMIKAGTYDPNGLSNLDLPESMYIKKASYSGSDGGGLSAGLDSVIGFGASKDWGTSYGVSNEKMNDGKGSIFLEKFRKSEVGVSILGNASADKVSPSEIRTHLENLEDGDLKKFIEDVGPEATDIVMQNLDIEPGDQLKVIDESKITVSAPVLGAEGAGEVLEGFTLSYETKKSFVVGQATVDIERKYEVKDPVGLAKRIGVNVESLAGMLESGQITRDVLRQKLKGDLTDYLQVEVKVQHRLSDTQGILGVGGLTASRTEFAKPTELYSSKIGKDGKKIRTGVLNDAVDKLGEDAMKASKKTARSLSELRMSDFTHHVIKG
jgi:hypothetical protein